MNFLGARPRWLGQNLALASEITGGGGGSAVIKTAVIDFGQTPASTEAFTITDASVTTLKNILAIQSAQGTGGRADDESEMDPLVLRAKANAGSITIYATSLDGPVVGKYRINYQVG